MFRLPLVFILPAAAVFALAGAVLFHGWKFEPPSKDAIRL